MSPSRSARREVRNPVLFLPAVAALRRLDPAVTAALAAVLGDLAADARCPAQISWAQNKGGDGGLLEGGGRLRDPYPPRLALVAPRPRRELRPAGPRRWVFARAPAAVPGWEKKGGAAWGGGSVPQGGTHAAQSSLRRPALARAPAILPSATRAARPSTLRCGAAEQRGRGARLHRPAPLFRLLSRGDRRLWPDGGAPQPIGRAGRGGGVQRAGAAPRRRRLRRVGCALLRPRPLPAARPCARQRRDLVPAPGPGGPWAGQDRRRRPPVLLGLPGLFRPGPAGGSRRPGDLRGPLPRHLRGLVGPLSRPRDGPHPVAGRRRHSDQLARADEAQARRHRRPLRLRDPAPARRPARGRWRDRRRTSSARYATAHSDACAIAATTSTPSRADPRPPVARCGAGWRPPCPTRPGPMRRGHRPAAGGQREGGAGRAGRWQGPLPAQFGSPS